MARAVSSNADEGVGCGARGSPPHITASFGKISELGDAINSPETN